ncbi:MAG: glycosyltransferase [Sediminibacterium sp.]
MLSIIICSQSKLLCKQLVANIRKTIGIPFDLEIITDAASITQAYQKGLKNRKQDFCLFLHEDVLFHTKGWGKSLLNYFKSDPLLGLIGVAGAKTHTFVPSAWWDCAEKDKVIRLLQHKLDAQKEDQNQGFDGTNLVEVAVVDGVFMALRKEVGAHFDQALFGFHGYDLDISLAVQEKGYKVAVMQDVLLEHFSLGNLHLGWLNAILQVHRKHKLVLPLAKGGAKSSSLQEFRNLVQLFKHYIKLH